MLNRRQFFTRAAVAAAALVVDPEQLLWTPGKKTFFLPPAKPALIVDARAVAALKEIAALAADYNRVLGVYHVSTGIGRAVFDQDWNLLTMNGQTPTPLEAARMQSALYQRGMPPRHDPHRLREMAREITARRTLAGIPEPRKGAN
jgi:hypothetical protein